MKECRECNALNEDGQDVCVDCGTPLGDVDGNSRADRASPILALPAPGAGRRPALLSYEAHEARATSETQEVHEAHAADVVDAVDAARDLPDDAPAASPVDAASLADAATHSPSLDADADNPFDAPASRSERPDAPDVDDAARAPGRLIDNKNLEPYFQELEKARRSGTRIVVNVGFSGAGKSWLSARMGAEMTKGAADTTLYAADARPDRMDVQSNDELPRTQVHEVRAWYVPARGANFALLLIDLAGELVDQIESDPENFKGEGLPRLLFVTLAYADALIFVVDGPGVVDPSNAPADDGGDRRNSGRRKNRIKGDELHKSLLQHTFRYLAFVRAQFAKGPFPDSVGGVVDVLARALEDNPRMREASDAGDAGCPVPTFFAITKADRLDGAIADARRHRRTTDAARDIDDDTDEADADEAHSTALDDADGLERSAAPAAGKGRVRIANVDPTSFALRYLPTTHAKALTMIARFRWGLVAPFAGQPPKGAGKNETVDYERPSYGVKALYRWLQVELALPARSRPQRMLRGTTTARAIKALFLRKRQRRLRRGGALRWRFLAIALVPLVVLAAAWYGYRLHLTPEIDETWPVPAGIALSAGQTDLSLSPAESDAFDDALRRDDALPSGMLPPMAMQLGIDRVDLWTQSFGSSVQYAQARALFDRMHDCSFSLGCSRSQEIDLGRQALRALTGGDRCDGALTLKAANMVRVPLALHAVSLAWSSGCEEAAKNAFEALRVQIDRGSLQRQEEMLGLAYVDFALAKLRLKLDAQRSGMYLSIVSKISDTLGETLKAGKRVTEENLPALGVSRRELDAELRLARLLDLMRTQRGSKLDAAVREAKLVPDLAPADFVAIPSYGAAEKHYRLVACALAFRFGNGVGQSHECLVTLFESAVPDPVRGQVVARLAVLDGTWRPVRDGPPCNGSDAAACRSLYQIAARADTWKSVRDLAPAEGAPDEVRRYLLAFADSTGNFRYWLDSKSQVEQGAYWTLRVLFWLAVLFAGLMLLGLPAVLHFFPGRPGRD